MIQPIHMPGPVRVSDSTFTQLPGENLPRWELRVSLQASVAYAHREEDARLLRAAYNAFDSAAKRLNCNAIELAERMQDGGIAELIEALTLLEEGSDCGDYGEIGIDNPTPMTHQPGERCPICIARAAIAKVKGGTT